MTWAEFKAKVESQDVKDDDEIWYIDVSFDFGVYVLKDDPCGIAIQDG